MSPKRFVSLHADLPESPAGCMPVVRLTIAEINSLLDEGHFWPTTFALFGSDDGYSFAVMQAGGPPLGDLPAPFAVALADRDVGCVRGPYGHDLDSIEDVVKACDALAFTAAERDAAGAAEMMEAVISDLGSIVIVDTSPEWVGPWLAALQAIRADIPVLDVGYFAKPAVLN